MAFTLDKLAYYAGWDAGCKSMRESGRKAWNEEDYNIAAKEQNRILDNLKRKEAKHGKRTA